MIHILDNKNKRSDICKIDYIYTAFASIRNYPGDEILISGEWLPVRFSSASFTEKDETNGEPVVQELSVKIAGLEKEAEQTVREICGIELLIRLQYSSGEIKVIGTEDNPVSLSYSFGGSPVVCTLYCNRNSAERAKYFKSF
jgi:hypothetical protein